MIKDNSRLFAMGRPLSLDDAALLMIALSFGPLSKNDLTRALKQAGMTMPDGSVITVERLASCVQRLRAKCRIISLGSAMSCPPGYASGLSRQSVTRARWIVLERPCKKLCRGR